MSKKMEMALADDIKLINLRSLTGVKDGIKDGEIPDWILVELLIRLPQKVVFKFKLVSKNWLSLILDPTFVKTYISRASSLQKLQPWTFIATDQVFSNNKNKYLPDCEMLVDVHSSNYSQWPNFYAFALPILPNPYPRPRLHEKEYRLHQLSNGIVLYGSYNVNKGMSVESLKLRVCNPVTNQWIALPLHDILTKYVKWGFMTKVEDGVLISFTVVCLYESIRIPGKLLFEVFSSETGEWKKHTVPFDTRTRLVLMSKCEVFNGIMHWMIRKNKMIAYDPLKNPDHLYTITFPGEQELYNNLLAAYQERLRYFEIAYENESSPLFNVWVLNDYTSGDWCLQQRVYLRDVQIPNTIPAESLSGLGAISFHPYDSDVAFLKYDDMILSYNIKSRKLEVAVSQVRGFVPWTLTHVLVVPPWPISFSPSLASLPGNISG